MNTVQIQVTIREVQLNKIYFTNFPYRYLELYVEIQYAVKLKI